MKLNDKISWLMGRVQKSLPPHLGINDTGLLIITLVTSRNIEGKYVFFTALSLTKTYFP